MEKKTVSRRKNFSCMCCQEYVILLAGYKFIISYFTYFISYLLLASKGKTSSMQACKPITLANSPKNIRTDVVIQALAISRREL